MFDFSFEFKEETMNKDEYWGDKDGGFYVTKHRWKKTVEDFEISESEYYRRYNIIRDIE